ncbi:MAG: lysine 2,3-aminomutase [Anaerolineae bacterium]
MYEPRPYCSIPLWEDVDEETWNDWRWQIANRITTVEELDKVIHLTEAEKQIIERSLNSLRMAITPYYASLMDPDDATCPIRMRAVPTLSETEIRPEDEVDPLAEDVDSPVPGITHRYPDRVLFLVTDQCSMYCRHCTRRRMAGETDRALPASRIDDMIDYVREARGVRDVLLSGGDPLTLSTGRLESIVARLHEIPHVEIVRYGSAVPVVMPQRVTDELVTMMKKYQPVWLNTHFNHPKEMTPAARRACAKLADNGIVLGNQSVLLRGVNDCPIIMKELVQRLIHNRVRPYYIYQCDLSQGIGHFRTSIGKGIEIIEHLWGHTSGFAVPRYVKDVPGGVGKTPIDPCYIVSRSDRMVIFRNYEGVIGRYIEPDEPRSGGCPEECLICEERRQRGLDEPEVGLARLFSGEVSALEPADLDRHARNERARREGQDA